MNSLYWSTTVFKGLCQSAIFPVDDEIPLGDLIVPAQWTGLDCAVFYVPANTV